MVFNNFDMDYEYGIQKEEECMPYIEKYFDIKLRKTHTRCRYDFSCEGRKFLVEVKSRRISINDYKDTMITYGKINYFNLLRKYDWEIILVFNFTEGTFFYRYEEENPEWIRMGGRFDCGYFQEKKYYFVPIKELQKINATSTKDSGIKENTEGVYKSLLRVPKETPKTKK